MKYPVIVYHSETSDYCGLLPDFPGMFLAEKSLDALLASIQDAVETWMEGESPEALPQPSSLQTVSAREDAAGRTLLLADVDPAFLDHATTRISVSVPRYALNLIDKAAKRIGKKRSTFLVESALAASCA